MELQQSRAHATQASRVPLVGKEKKCSVGDCDARHYAKGCCKKHYTQVLRHGKLTPDRERGVVRTCKAKDCGRTDTIRWYCRKHARQIRVHGKLTPDREHVMGFDGCSVPRCKEPHRAKGFCAKHYNQDRWNRLKTVRAKKGKQQRQPAKVRKGASAKASTKAKKRGRR